MPYPPLKRLLDAALSGILLVILLPLMIIIGVLALVLHGRPVLFVQVRPGLHERPFRLLKFRTMARDNLGSGSHSEEKQTTRLGKILRSLSLDELPQLFNILLGEMSFVGPRPLLMEYLPFYSNHQKRRHNVRPGLTGLAQVEGRNQVPWERRLALDVVYATNQSLAMDIRIVLNSFVVVLTRKGVSANGSEIMPRFRGTQMSDSE